MEVSWWVRGTAAAEGQGAQEAVILFSREITLKGYSAHFISMANKSRIMSFVLVETLINRLLSIVVITLEDTYV